LRGFVFLGWSDCSFSLLHAFDPVFFSPFLKGPDRERNPFPQGDFLQYVVTLFGLRGSLHLSKTEDFFPRDRWPFSSLLKLFSNLRVGLGPFPPLPNGHGLMRGGVFPVLLLINDSSRFFRSSDSCERPVPFSLKRRRIILFLTSVIFPYVRSLVASPLSVRASDVHLKGHARFTSCETLHGGLFVYPVFPCALFSSRHGCRGRRNRSFIFLWKRQLCKRGAYPHGLVSWCGNCL